MAAPPIPIAVIGMGCRLPGGVTSPESLWTLLSTGGSGLSTVPSDRWNADAFYHPDQAAREALNTKKGYFLTQDVSHFDAKFFGFSASEADQTDPQQRLMLETAYEALENAGIPIETLRGSDTSVFVSVFARDYDRMTYKDLPAIGKGAITGNGEAILAARISYVFDLRGGAMTIDTGCSGSMVAIHQACNAIRAGESRIAIAGGTQLLLHPDQFMPWSYNGMANPEGQSFAFDSRGAGYGRGEGVGAVILKRLDHAIADGDSIHAVIRGSGINQDGKTNGILLPNGLSQKALVKQVYENAGLDPAETLYFEAHGTGTQAGDKAEIQSISEALGTTKRESALPVGSVKANLGHLEAAAGIAGFIKAVMVLKKGQIPPQVNFIQEKPGLNLAEKGIKVPVELTPLVPASHKGPYRVSVNSYGYGGTNAHVLLELPEQGRVINGHSNGLNGTHGANGINGVNGTAAERISNGKPNGIHTPGTSPSSSSTAAHPTAPLLFPLVAHSDESLLALPKILQQWLSATDRSISDLKDLSYTLSCRRSAFRWRNVLTAASVEELLSKLAGSPAKSRAALTTNVAFIFTGQGAQWHAMGRELISTSAVFRESLLEMEGYLREFGCDWSLIEELKKSENDTRVGEGGVSQPATTAVQVALVDLLASFGIRPQWVLGHSSGEIAAAYAAGKLGRRAVMQAASFRGRYSTLAKEVNTKKGAMCAVALGEEHVLPIIKIANATSGGHIRVACVNSPDSVTVSGDEVGIDALVKHLSHSTVFVRKLKVDTAYHSHHMENIAEQYLDSLRDMPLEDGQSEVKFFSSVTGGLKTDGFGGEYWTQNLVSKVSFSEALQALAADMANSSGSARDHANLFIEVGPHTALQGPVRQTLAQLKTFQYQYCGSLVRKKDASRTVLETAARFFELGYPVNLRAVLDMGTGSSSHSRHHVVHDLPAYPWDHRLRHWRESRLSRDHRLRKFGYHDLLGLRDVASPLDEPRWRYHISVDRLPWLKDHVVEAQVIWPGTGYMCMAMEAVKQLTQLRHPDSTVRRIIFKDAEVRKAVIVPDVDDATQNSEVEVQLTLSRSSTSDGSPWDSIRILSALPDGSWIENYTGLIRADLASANDADESDWAGNEGVADQALAIERLRTIQALAKIPASADGLYADMKAAGNEFGPSFTTLTSIWTGKRVAFAQMVVPDIARNMPGSHMEPHTIHPAVLDVPNHVMGLLFYEECCKAAVMPTTTSEFRISTDVDLKAGDELLIACEITPEGKRAAKGNTWIFKQPSTEGDEPTLICATTEIQLRAVGDAAATTEDTPFKRKMVSRITWGDHIDFISDETHRHTMAAVYKVPEGRMSIHEQLLINDQAAAIHLERAQIQNITRPADAPPHLDIFHDWINNFLGSDLHKELLKDVPTEEDKDLILKKVVGSSSADATGQMLVRLSEHLPAILRGETHSLDIMVQDDLLNRFYMDGPLEASNAQAGEFVRRLTHCQPHMSVLEIGAGTGSTTMSVLENMSPFGELLLNKYTYTDISAGFFDAAATKFAKWRHAMEFKTLDCTRDPLEQGYEEGTYNLIIASNVIHATPHISVTLANVRKLLKPGGRFVLLEVTRPTVAEGMIFGTLSGWWASEDGRKGKGSPLLTREGWDEALRAAGFNGIELASYDYDGPLARTSVMVSKAIVTPAPVKGLNGHIIEPRTATIVTNSQTRHSVSLLAAVTSALESKGLVCTHTTWDSVPVNSDPSHLYVVLDAAENAVLANPSPEAFASFRSILPVCLNILWIGYQESESDILVANRGLATGAARSLRRENEEMHFISFEIQDILTADVVTLISETASRMVGTAFFPETPTHHFTDYEFSMRDGRLLVPRVRMFNEFLSWADRLNGNGRLEPGLYYQVDRPLKLEVQVTGLLSSLCFADDPDAIRPLEDDEIQIQARAYGVNFRDVFIALGQLPPTSPMAGEVAGVVTAVGKGKFCSENFKVGDRVISLLGPGYASQARVKGVHANKLPDSVGFVEGASIYTVFQTVYYALVEVARLEEGQTLLIHSASGGVGQAAIQIAKWLGASDIFATLGSESKRAFVAQQFGIPESHIFSSRWAPREIKRRVMRLTNGRGVDVVINSLAGEMLNESWDCLAPLGTHIELGKADIYKKNYLPMAPFDMNRTFAAVDLTVLLTQIPLKMFKLLGKVLKLFDEGILKPVTPLNVLPIDKIESAFRMIAERKHMGKVILEITNDAVVDTVVQPPPALKLNAEGTYLIAGGLGDLGQRMTRILAGFGAGHIVTLSRRDLEADAQAKLEGDIEKLGAKLHIMKCDITDRQSVERVKQLCSSLPPVRGIIQGGMVLRDRPLTNMELEDWNISLGPKVTGTLNLDNAFASPNLDFFITLSSLTGVVGRLAQSNYSAANNFMDTYMIQRNAHSETSYFTINVGAVVGSDSIKNMTASKAQQELLNQAPITFPELFQVLRYAMDPSTAFEGRAQACTGFDRQSLLTVDHIAAANMLFSSLAYTDEAGGDGSKAANAKVDAGAALRAAKTVDEAVEVISTAIADKFVTFLNRELEDISFDQPLSTFGLDSLVSIELKNWMMRSFGVTLQASELSGPASILALSRTLVGRSTLVNKDILTNGVTASNGPIQASEEPSVEKETTNGTTDSTLPVTHPKHGKTCCSQFAVLPKQPVPDLDKIMQTHIDNVSHLAHDASELEDFRDAVRELCAPGGTGRRIFDEITSAADDPSVENWLSVHLDKAIHLDWRHGVPYASFMMLQHDSKLPHSQAERAAIIATAAFGYKNAMESGEDTAQWQFAGAQCNHLLPWLFNSVREPALGSDISRKYSGDYFVALRKGRVFKVPYKNGAGDLLSMEEVKDIIEDILERVQDEGSWAGMLTTDNRDNWAKNRQELLALETSNVAYLAAIEAAVLVINLDEQSPTTLKERIDANMFSGGFNRWWDKPMQFIVNENGRSAVILEHSRIDGVTALPLLYVLGDAIKAYKPRLTNGIANGTTNGYQHIVAEEFKLVTTPEIDAHIDHTRHYFKTLLDAREFISHSVAGMGKKFMMSHGMPIKGVTELLVQLANYRYHCGVSSVSWEGVALAHFHHGRHDMIQTVSPAVARFCALADAVDAAQTETGNGGVDDEDKKDLPTAKELRALMVRTAGEMTAAVKESAAGNGFFRPMDVIKNLWPREEPLARYFEHPIFTRLNNFEMVVTMLDPISPAAAAMPANAAAMRIRFAVEDDELVFGLTGPRGTMGEWPGAFDWAAGVIRGIILEGKE